MKFRSRRPKEFYYDEEEPEKRVWFPGTVSHARRRRGNPLRSFLAALAVLLGAGFLLLLVISLLQSADARAAGAGTLQSVAEERIPSPAEQAGVMPAGSGGESAEAGETAEQPEAGQVSGRQPASEHLSFSGGRYVLTETAAPDLVTFAFAGDILFDDRYAAAASVNQRGGDIASAFDEASLAVMRTADVFCVNNEFPYSDRGTPTEGKAYTFRAKPGRVSWLLDMGVDVAALANNHAYDYGEEAFLDTLDVLDGAGILRVGGGRNLEEASAPCIFEVNGYTIALLNATQIERLDFPDTRGAGETTPGVFRCFDDTRLLAAIRDADSRADFVIVLIHWGTESTHETDWLQTSRVGAMEEAGADLVVGAHPHVLQGIAYSGDMPVIYSLGNYFFSSFTTDTGILQATFQPSAGKLVQLRFVPMLQENCRVTALSGAEKERVLSALRAWSPGVQITDDGVISK